MARIRTIKPEFWTSEQIAECSPTARLAFIGIWSFSDDHGIHPASIKRLKMEVFPSDQLTESAIQDLIDELSTAALLASYEADGRAYWQVTGWKKHQRIDKPTYRHPLPSGETALQNSTPPRRVIADVSPSPRLRNGMESKGSILSGNPDAISIIDYLNQKTARNYQPVKANLSLVLARLKEGFTPDQCRAVIDAKVSDWASDSKMADYLRPKTLFSAVNFAQYVGELSGQRAEESWE